MAQRIQHPLILSAKVKVRLSSCHFHHHQSHCSEWVLSFHSPISFHRTLRCINDFKTPIKLALHWLFSVIIILKILSTIRTLLWVLEDCVFTCFPYLVKLIGWLVLFHLLNIFGIEQFLSNVSQKLLALISLLVIILTSIWMGHVMSTSPSFGDFVHCFDWLLVSTSCFQTAWQMTTFCV